MKVRVEPKRRWKWLRRILLTLLLLALVGVAIRLFNPLPSLEGRSVSTALPAEADTPLRRAIAPAVGSMIAVGRAVARIGADAVLICL